jgi:hypothetical protein
MDPRRFEDITRRVAAAASRRGALKALLGAMILPALLGLRGEGADAGIPIVHCKAPGKRCDGDQRCCSGNCRKSICTCAKKGKQCWAPLEGALCCSQRCAGGKCA